MPLSDLSSWISEHWWVLLAALLIGFPALVWLLNRISFPAWTGLGPYEDHLGKTHQGRTLWEWTGVVMVPLTIGIVGAALTLVLSHQQQSFQRAQAREVRVMHFYDVVITFASDGELSDDDEHVIRGVLQTFFQNRADAEMVNEIVRLIESFDAAEPSLALQAAVQTGQQSSDGFVSRVDEPSTPDPTTIPEDSGQGDDVQSEDAMAEEALADDVWDELPAGDSDDADSITPTPAPPVVTANGINFADFDLSGLDLESTSAKGWNFSNAILSESALNNADLSYTDLISAKLVGAELRGANLFGADLTGADLTGADLTGALYDEQTRWPDGFDPSAAGATLVRDGG